MVEKRGAVAAGHMTESAGAEPRRVLLVDDHPVVRQGLRVLIDQEPDLIVCGDAGGADEAVAAVNELSPDVVLVDLRLGESSGIDLISRLKQDIPDIRVLVFSMHDESIYAERALRAGARGYVVKESPPEALVEAIRRILDGGVVLSEAATSRILRRTFGEQEREGQFGDEVLDRLSQREQQVFTMIGRGIATGEIATELGLSVKTVDSHRANIKRKLGLRDGAELVRRAIHWVDSECGV